MAQFDNLIIFPLFWSSILILFFYYTISIKIVIPKFFGAKKFREKPLMMFSAFNLAVISFCFVDFNK